MNIGVILAGGDGSRFHSQVHKQYLKLNGKEVVYYALSQMREAKLIDKILLVVDEEEYANQYIANKYHVECLKGGDTRNQSVRNALDYISAHYPDCLKVIFHDSVRPFVKSDVFDKILRKLDKYDAVATIRKISDTLSDANLNYVDRGNFVLIQAPEAFLFPQFNKVFDAYKKDTALINQITTEMKSYKFELTDFNFKINYPEDLFLAEQLMRINYTKNGFDEQKIDIDKIKGRVLLLGGSGGMGSALIDVFKEHKINYYAPSLEELDLGKATYRQFENLCLPFKPDIIINTAAVSFDDNDGLIEKFDIVMNVNLRSNLYIIELAKALHKRVNIVVISSSSSTMGRQNITNYSASKAALNSVVESQAEKLHEQSIYLNAIVPEKVNTPMIARLHKTDINLRELLPVSDVISVILNYCVTKEYGKLVHIRKGL